MSEEVRLDDNEIRISGAPRTEVTVSGCNARAKNPQHKVIAPLAETVEAHSRVWVSLPIARPNG